MTNNRVAELRAHIDAGAVGRRVRVVRSRGGWQLLDQSQRIELHHGDLRLAPHRHVREATVLRERHLVRIAPDGDLRHHRATLHVHHLKVPGLVAGQIHLRAVGRDREPVRTRVHLDATQLRELHGVDFHELVGIAEGDPKRMRARLGGESCRRERRERRD
jgi:hypothetical protein